MKKSILFLCTMLCGATMNAQLVSSHSASLTTSPKAPSRTTWMMRVGVGTNTFAGDKIWEDVGSKAVYFFGFEFNKTLGKRGAYWGMDFALASRGYKFSEDEDRYSYETKLAAHAIQWSPFIFGWKIDVPNSKFSIDPHIGAYVSCDYAGKYTEEAEYHGEKESEEVKIGDVDDYNRLDVGLKVGVGVWYNKKYNLDFTYQRGFFTDDMDVDGGTSNFWFRLGYAF